VFVDFKQMLVTQGFQGMVYCFERKKIWSQELIPEKSRPERSEPCLVQSSIFEHLARRSLLTFNIAFISFFFDELRCRTCR